VPPAFESLKRKLGHRIVQFGWLESYADYQRLLGQSDVFISTAQHEFFGIAVMEGVAAGCRPLLPRSLVYPELFGDAPVFHDGTPTGLANALAELASGGTATWPDLRHIAESHTWPNRAESMDARIDALVDAAPVDAAG
jgi:glycosyltransferase involved in cell wall biosynthesis